jgi:hypothetical protein
MTVVEPRTDPCVDELRRKLTGEMSLCPGSVTFRICTVPKGIGIAMGKITHGQAAESNEFPIPAKMAVCTLAVLTRV